jgi:hypothetical protein
MIFLRGRYEGYIRQTTHTYLKLGLILMHTTDGECSERSELRDEIFHVDACINIDYANTSHLIYCSFITRTSGLGGSIIMIRLGRLINEDMTSESAILSLWSLRVAVPTQLLESYRQTGSAARNSKPV